MADAEKERLRAEGLARRDAEPEREAKGEAIREYLRYLPIFGRARTVATYVGVKSEVPTLPLIEEMLAGRKRVLVPAVVGSDVRLVRIDSTAELVAAPFGLLSPERGSATVSTGGPSLPRSTSSSFPGSCSTARGAGSGTARGSTIGSLRGRVPGPPRWGSASRPRSSPPSRWVPPTSISSTWSRNGWCTPSSGPAASAAEAARPLPSPRWRGLPAPA